MNILISIDDNYVRYAINLIDSISQNNNEELNIFLIHDNHLSSDSIRLLNKFMEDNNIGKLNTIYFDGDSINLPKYIDYISINTYYRLFAPYLLPKDIKRILYLDCDIICNGNISDLYNTDFDNKLIIGCENMLPSNLQIWKDKNRIRLNLPEDYIYINAGVLLINLEKYRKSITKEEILSFINKNSERLIFQDQDVINKLFYKDIKHVDTKYNYQINTTPSNNPINNIKLVHYSERMKPWNMNYDDPEKAIFYYNLIKNRGDYELLKVLIEKHYQNKANNLYNKLINENDKYHESSD